MRYPVPANFPRMLKIRQKLPRSAPIDVEAVVRSQLAQKLDSRINPGARIALAVGSRGITNLQAIVSAAVEWIRGKGALPFIVPAMGSHGGATAGGPAAVLADYGITESSAGALSGPSMDGQLLCRLGGGV